MERVLFPCCHTLAATVSHKAPCWPEILRLLQTFRGCVLLEEDLLPNGVRLSLASVVTTGRLLLPIETHFAHLSS